MIWESVGYWRRSGVAYWSGIIQSGVFKNFGTFIPNAHKQRNVLLCKCSQFITPPEDQFCLRIPPKSTSNISIIYNSDLPVTLSTNLLRMLVLLVNSSSFAGAKPPFFKMLSKRANSLAAYPSLLVSLSKTLT